MNHSAWRTPFVLALSLTSGLGLALGTECPVGVNVNSFQNFSAAEQQMIVEQLKSCGVSFVRTSLRPDDKAASSIAAAITVRPLVIPA